MTREQASRLHATLSETDRMEIVVAALLLGEAWAAENNAQTRDALIAAENIVQERLDAFNALVGSFLLHGNDVADDALARAAAPTATDLDYLRDREDGS